MRFCASGTSSGGSSTPRSPRATITASVSSTISSRFSSACGFSSFTITPARPRDQLPRLGDVLRPLHEGQPDVVGAMLQREGEVVAVLRGQRRDRQHHVRHVDALAVGQRAARHDLGLGEILAALRRPRAARLPSSSSSGAAARAPRRSPDAAAARGSRRRRLVEVEPELLPGCSATLPPAKLPTRSFGPCTSARMPIGRSTVCSSARIMVMRAAWSSCVPWLKFSRNTSAPAWNSAAISSGVRAGGAERGDDLGGGVGVS